MGTVALVRVEGLDDSRPALRAARRVVLRLDCELSRFRLDSDVNQINAAAGEWVEVGEDAAALVGRCVDMARRTRGAFNPLIGDAVAAWRAVAERGEGLSGERVAPAPTAIEVEGRRVRIPSGAVLDFGAVGKGYAADRALEACLAAGAERALVSIGSSSISVGPEGGRPVTVGLDSPYAGAPAVVGQLSFVGSLSVSGGHDIVRGGGLVRSHIIDPVTMSPALTDVASVAVVGTDGVNAEAFSTTMVVLGKDRALQLGLDEGIDMVLFTVAGKIFASPSIAKDFRVTPEAG